MMNVCMNACCLQSVVLMCVCLHIYKYTHTHTHTHTHYLFIFLKVSHFLVAHYQVDLTVAVLDEAFSHPLHKNTNVRYIHFVA